MELPIYSYAAFKHDSRIFKNTPGVYAILYCGEVLYIGQSVNVRSRLLSHMNTKSNLKQLERTKDTEYFNPVSYKISRSRYEFLEEHKDELFFLCCCAEPNELNELEEKYINKYKPCFNYAGVIGDYHGVNHYSVSDFFPEPKGESQEKSESL